MSAPRRPVRPVVGSGRVTREIELVPMPTSADEPAPTADTRNRPQPPSADTVPVPASPAPETVAAAPEAAPTPPRSVPDEAPAPPRVKQTQTRIKRPANAGPRVRVEPSGSGSADVPPAPAAPEPKKPRRPRARHRDMVRSPAGRATGTETPRERPAPPPMAKVRTRVVPNEEMTPQRPIATETADPHTIHLSAPATASPSALASRAQRSSANQPRARQATAPDPMPAPETSTPETSPPETSPPDMSPLGGERQPESAPAPEMSPPSGSLGSLNIEPDSGDETKRLSQTLQSTQRLYHESRRRFHDFVLSASDWVWETNEHGTIIFVSDRITELLAKPSRLLIGTNLLDLGIDVVAGRSLGATLESRRPFRGHAMEIVSGDGKHRFCRLSGVPAFEAESGRFIGYRGAGSDCTAQFEAEAAASRSQSKLERLVDEIRTKNERLKTALADAEAAVHAKSEFLANVSHELRTPLNAIIGFTEIMEKEMYGPLGHDRYKDYADYVLQSGRHLLDIINDLLDMAKVEAGKLELNETRVAVESVVEATLALMRDRILAQGLKLEVRLPSNGPLLWADERLLKQMLINLLANSIKFTQEGGTIMLTGEVARDGSYALSVSDTGIGISEQDLERVLEPFGQVESAMSRTHDGTGLGLPLVNAMIKLHAGTLELRSSVGVGTTATLRLPSERVLDRPANAQA